MIIIMGKGNTGAGYMYISLCERVKADKSVYGRRERERLERGS